MIGDYVAVMTGGAWNLTGLANASEAFTGGWWADEASAAPGVITVYSLNERRPDRVHRRKERALYIRGRYRP